MKRIESETLELKKSTSELKAGIVSLAAMLNKHHRGELWFGIKNDGTAVGQVISEASLREVSRSFKRLDARQKTSGMTKGVSFPHFFGGNPWRCH